jgi:hypothetical protein
VLAAVVAVALAYVIVEGADRRWLALREDTVPVADGVGAPAAEAAELEATVRAVRRAVPPGEPIYVAPRRSDLVTAGNPLLYVLADRPNPTRYDIQAPGVVTSAPVQRELVRDLRRARVRLVVRDTSAVTATSEPNAAGRSSGVRLLDEYLERDYRELERHGALVVLVSRRGPGTR